MKNYEFVKSLKEILETKSLSEIREFVEVLRKAYLKGEDEFLEDDTIDEFELDSKDLSASLNCVERFFNKGKNGFDYDDEAYQQLLPCYYEIIEDEDFLDLFAEKLEDTKYTPDNSEEIVESINAFMDLYEEDNFDNPEDEMDFDILGRYFNNVVRDKLSELSVDDFIKLRHGKLNEYFDDIIIKKIKKMNEIQMYKYLSYIDYDVMEDREYEIEKRLKELDSPALYNLYDSINYNSVETRDKIKSLYYMKSEAIEEVKPNILLSEDASQSKRFLKVIFAPKYNEDDYENIAKLPKYKKFLKKLSELNNNEIVLYLLGKYINVDEIKIDEEKELLESRIKQLPDEDIKVLYCVLDKEKNKQVADEIARREIVMDDNVIETQEYSDYKYFSIKDEKLAARIDVYERVNDYTIDLLELDKPIFSTKSARDKAENMDNTYIKSICAFERCDDLQCIKIVNNLNRNEHMEDYNCLSDDINEINLKSDEEKLNIYKHMVKFQMIKYMEKRLLSMPKGYLSMIDVSNEDGVFNDVVEIGLDGEEIKLKKNENEEYELDY